MPLNQKQKAIADKAVKLRFNGLSRQLGEAKTEDEIKYVELKAPVAAGTGYYDNTAYCHKTTKEVKIDEGTPVRIVRKYEKLFKYQEESKVQNELHDKEEQTLKEKYQAALKELRSKHSSIDLVRGNAESKLNLDAQQSLREENIKRREKRTAGQKARHDAIKNLNSQRDECLLQIAFEGEGEEMLTFLSNLVTPESVAKSLGMKLSKQLELTTGIGERNPQDLQ